MVIVNSLSTYIGLPIFPWVLFINFSRSRARRGPGIEINRHKQAATAAAAAAKLKFTPVRRRESQYPAFCSQHGGHEIIMALLISQPVTYYIVIKRVATVACMVSADLCADQCSQWCRHMEEGSGEVW